MSIDKLKQKTIIDLIETIKITNELNPNKIDYHCYKKLIGDKIYTTIEFILDDEKIFCDKK